MPTLTAIVEQIYGCLAVGDLAGMLRHAAADVVLTQDERLPWGGRHVGHGGVAAFAIILATTVDTEITSDQIFEAGDTVVQVGRTRGFVRATGDRFDIPECHVWRFRDSNVVAAEFFIESGTLLPMLKK